MADIKVKHLGVEIFYDESRNRWSVDDEETGITLNRVSLDEARKGIDAALRNKKKKTFKRFEAWYFEGYGHINWVKVTVTSYVERNSSYDLLCEAWITLPKSAELSSFRNSRKGRMKVSVSELYKVTKTNDSHIVKMLDITKQVAKLEKDRTKIMEKLTPIPIPAMPEDK